MKNRGFLKDGIIIICITVGLLILLDTGVRIAFHFYDNRPDYRIEADAFESEEFAKKYFEEFDKANTVRWEPYVYWRRNAFSGEFINIDNDGVRKTVNPVSNDTSALQMFIFGGSTLWGTGATDAGTIPSFVSKKLNDKGIAVEVHNFGETGYASTQNVVMLIRLLQAGKQPDMVIFYDGVNDIYNALQRGYAGDPSNEFNRVAEFNLTLERGRLYRTAIRTFFSQGLVRLFSGLFAEYDIPDDEALIKLSGEITDVYFQNIAMVNALAEAYDFTAFFFWQPSVFTKEYLTEFEQNELKRQSHVQKLYDLANAEVLNRGLVNETEAFHDLTNAFNGKTEPFYIDFCHLSAAGNEFVAREIVERLVENVVDKGLSE